MMSTSNCKPPRRVPSMWSWKGCPVVNVRYFPFPLPQLTRRRAGRSLSRGSRLRCWPALRTPSWRATPGSAPARPGAARNAHGGLGAARCRPPSTRWARWSTGCTSVSCPRSSRPAGSAAPRRPPCHAHRAAALRSSTGLRPGSALHGQHVHIAGAVQLAAAHHEHALDAQVPPRSASRAACPAPAAPATRRAPGRRRTRSARSRRWKPPVTSTRASATAPAAAARHPPGRPQPPVGRGHVAPERGCQPRRVAAAHCVQGARWTRSGWSACASGSCWPGPTCWSGGRIWKCRSEAWQPGGRYRGRWVGVGKGEITSRSARGLPGTQSIFLPRMEAAGPLWSSSKVWSWAGPATATPRSLPLLPRVNQPQPPAEDTLDPLSSVFKYPSSGRI